MCKDSHRISTEHWQKTSDLWKGKKISMELEKRKSKKKKERERKELEWNLWPWEGAVKEESFLPAGKSAYWRGDQSGQRGRFRALDEKTTCLQQLECRDTCTDGQCFCPHSPVSDACLLGTGGGWVGKLGFQRSDPERGLGVGSVETGWRGWHPMQLHLREGSLGSIRSQAPLWGEGRNPSLQPFPLQEFSGSRTGVRSWASPSLLLPLGFRSGLELPTPLVPDSGSSH